MICSRNSVGLTPVALKSAAGAAEELAILSVSQPGSFIDSCQQNGWKFYAASPPKASNSVVAGHDVPHYSAPNLGSPTQSHPCILMLGSEGEGLRWNIQKKADYSVSIEGQRTGFGELDSLNVSVAAGILCEAFMRPPAAHAVAEKVMGVPKFSDGPITEPIFGTKRKNTGLDITGIDDERSSDEVQSDRLF